MSKSLLFLVISVLLTASVATAQPAAEKTAPPAPARVTSAPIEAVLLHPLFNTDYACSEHWEGQLQYPGDSLGSDCMVYGGLPAGGKSGFVKTYKTDGSTNEDWYGWGQPVLAPLDAVVQKVRINPVVNQPGELGKPPASFVLFKHDDGTFVLVAHVAEVTVKEGDRVRAGQVFAKVGNNGFGRAPHIHVGAWREKSAMQIRFDLRAAGALRNRK